MSETELEYWWNSHYEGRLGKYWAAKEMARECWMPSMFNDPQFKNMIQLFKKEWFRKIEIECAYCNGSGQLINSHEDHYVCDWCNGTGERKV